MNVINLTRILLACAALAAQVLSAQTDIFTAVHTESLNGEFNVGRVRTDSTLLAHDLGQWNAAGTTGVTGDGRVWHSFARYKMFERDLFNKINAAEEITWTTGCWEKSISGVVDPDNGGCDVDVYLVLDPVGTVIPEGIEPNFSNGFDWANELGFGYENTVYLGRIPQSEPMATEEEKESARVISVDSPAMRVTFDATEAIKTWISEGKLSENSTIAIGLVQRAAAISDGAGNPKYDDVELYTQRIMGFSMGTSFIKTGPASTAKGPGPFSDYDLVDGYVDSGSWLGWVSVEQYPWCWIVNLSKWAWVTDSAGWVYIPK